MADEKDKRKASGAGKAGEGKAPPKDEKAKARTRSRAKAAGGPGASKEETPARGGARAKADAPKSGASGGRRTSDRTEGKGAKTVGAGASRRKAAGDKAADEKAAGQKPTGDKAPGEEDTGDKKQGAGKPSARRRPSVGSRGGRRERRPAVERPVVRARAKYVRSSPRKARLVMEHVRGKSVGDAMAVLRHSPRGVARELERLLSSAIANAENNHDLVGDDLYVQEIYADEGPTIKRFRPRAQGRAYRIRKRTSHLTVALSTKE